MQHQSELLNASFGQFAGLKRLLQHKKASGGEQRLELEVRLCGRGWGLTGEIVLESL